MSTSSPPINADRLVDTAGSLYSLPAVAMRILELVRSPDVNIEKLRQCLEQDPALAAKILRVVNSSLFGLTRQVRDLNQALALLGMKPLTMLVLGFSLPPPLTTQSCVEALSHYWKHALTKASAARELAQMWWKTPGEDAFVAALLQDLGILVLLKHLGAGYADFYLQALRQGADLREAEHASLGFDHVDISRGLLSRWGLPDGIVYGLGEPGDDIPATMTVRPLERMLPEITRAAEWMAQLLAERRRDALPKLLAQGRDLKGFKVDAFDDLADRLEAQVKEMGQVFSCQLPKELSYRQAVVEAHELLAAASEKVASERIGHAHEAPLPAFTPVWMGAIAPSDTNGNVARTGGATMAAEPMANGNTSSALATCDTYPLAEVTQQAMVRARGARRPISLLLFEIDRYDELAFQLGGAIAEVSSRMEELCERLDHDHIKAVEVREGRFAWITHGDRLEAVEFAKRLRSEVATEWRGVGMTLSLGVASLEAVAKGKPAKDLLDAAERCLRASQSQGGDTFKSIEIY